MPSHPRAVPTALAPALALGALLAAGLPAQASTPPPTGSPTGTGTSSPTVSGAPERAGRLDVAALQEIVDEAADDDVRLSVGVQSLDGATLTDDPVVVGSTEEFSSASLIKVALVTAVLRAVDRGDLALDRTVTVTSADDVPGTGVLAGYPSPYEATVAELCELAITVSDNTASNVLAEEVGLDEVDRLVEDLGLEPTHMGRLFFSDGPSDESNDLDTASTVELFRAVYAGEVLSPRSRDLLLGWMRAQELDTKLAPALPDVPVASKTGDTSEVSHAGAYLLEEGRETVLVVLSETEDGRSPTQAADPYLADVAAEIGAQVADAPLAPTPTPTVSEPAQGSAEGSARESAQGSARESAQDEDAVADAVRETLAEDDASEASTVPALGVVALGVVALLVLAVVVLRTRVLLRRRRGARR